MLLSKYLGPFTYYNIILLFLFSLSVDSIKLFSIINSISYVIFHYVIIYLGLYYYRNILYFLYFVYGLGIDLLLINQIGPHLLLFMTLLFFFKRICTVLFLTFFPGCVRLFAAFLRFSQRIMRLR